MTLKKLDQDLELKAYYNYHVKCDRGETLVTIFRQLIGSESYDTQVVYELVGSSADAVLAVIECMVETYPDNVQLLLASLDPWC